jgi:small subunit ribosomal protein S21
MPVVIVRKDEPIERALKRLSKLVTKEGIIQAVKQRRFYEKPSERKRKAKARAMKKRDKERYAR